MIVEENEKFYKMEELNNNDKSQPENQFDYWLKEQSLSSHGFYRIKEELFQMPRLAQMYHTCSS